MKMKLLNHILIGAVVIYRSSRHLVTGAKRAKETKFRLLRLTDRREFWTGFKPDFEIPRAASRREATKLLGATQIT